jgi:quercetin dioxygenase-like cupin family protein
VTSIESKFLTHVVPKKWGKEFLLYTNGIVSAWILTIEAGQETSLHAHPRKTTGLIVLDGIVNVSFLNDGRTMTALDKIVVHNHVFHRSQAVTAATILETECPIDKLDLIRFKDAYGREGEPYEDESTFRFRNKDEALLLDCNTHMFTVGESHVISRTFDGTFASDTLRYWLRDTVPDRWALTLMRGKIQTKKGVPVVIPGHVVWSQNLRELMEQCETDGDVELLIAWTNKQSTI